MIIFSNRYGLRMRFMFLIVPNIIFLNHVLIYLFIISRLDLLFYFFFYCYYYYYYYYYYLWNYLLANTACKRR